MMETEIYLKPASPSDIFSDDLKIKTNKIYFEYSYISNQLEGPYCISSNPSQTAVDEFYDKLFLCRQSIYVPHFEEYSNLLYHNVKLRLAKPDDLKESSKQKRVNFSYYLYEKNKFIGPFTIFESTNPDDIKKYLDEERIYVIDSPRNQREYFTNKKVS